MDRTLIIVARDRLNLFHHLIERQSPEVQVLLDRRHTPRPPRPPAPPHSAACYTSLERDGYIVVPTT